MAPEAMRQIMNGLIDNLSPSVPGSVLGEVFDRLVWILDDEGAELVRICRDWLTGDDRRRVEAALSLTEGFLYETRDELRAHLDPVIARWPELAGRAREILADWDAVHQSS
jgi:hypothetical protein